MEPAGGEGKIMVWIIVPSPTSGML